MRVLIFTASAGNGHNSTANRIKEKFLEKDKNTEIKIVDMYKTYTSKFKAWIMEGGYFLVCRYAIGLYNHFFKKSEKCTYEKRNSAKVNKTVEELQYGMLNTIYEYKPDIVISTYIFGAVALRNIKRVYKIPAKVVCMTLDYGVSPYWECSAEGLDKMFITSEYMYDQFIKKGFTPEQLCISGIPVASKFSNPFNKDEARKLLGLKDMFTLVVMKASFFPIKERKLIKQLSLVNEPIQIVIINGKDKKSQNKIDKYIKKYKPNHNIINIGYTNQVVEYFSSADLVLGKAGGLTTTECINVGLPSLILGKLPQQEIYNKEFLVKNNCALSVKNNTIAKEINNILSNRSILEQLKDSCIKLRKPNSLDIFYEEVSKFKPANYDNVELNDTKKQLNKKIRKARKMSI